MEKKNMKSISYFLIALLTTFSLISCEKDEEEPQPTKDIVQIAQENTSLSTFVAIVTEAGLANSLKGTGPFTVFAPSNDAFAALLGVVGQINPSNIPAEVIERILKYHVISGTA